jgi:hypothetical protein
MQGFFTSLGSQNKLEEEFHCKKRTDDINVTEDQAQTSEDKAMKKATIES